MYYQSKSPKSFSRYRPAILNLMENGWIEICKIIKKNNTVGRIVLLDFKTFSYYKIDT